jgi:hypothetical protein
MIGFPPEPMGESPMAIWLKNLLRFLKRTTVIDITGAKRKPQANGGVIYEIQFPQTRPGQGGMIWQTPNKELDPKLNVPRGTFVYVSQNNPICLTGLVDLVSGQLVQAQSGIWQANQNVPAQVTVAGVVKYNVPVVVTPAPVDGTPLSGDLDSETLFWIRWPETGACF